MPTTPSRLGLARLGETRLRANSSAPTGLRSSHSSKLGQFFLGIGQLADIVVTGSITSTQTIVGQSTIFGLLSTQTLVGQSVIHGVSVQNLLGIANIKNTTVQTLTGLANIVGSAGTTIDVGAFRTSYQMFCGAEQLFFTLSQSRSIVGQSNIVGATVQTLIGIGNILNTTVQTILGQASISAAGVTTRNIVGASVIVRQSTRSLVGFSNIANLATKTLVGQSYIQIQSQQQIVGTSNIQTTTTQNLMGQSVISVPTHFLTGFACIQATTTKTLLGQSTIYVPTVPPTAPPTLSASGVGAITLNWTAATDVVVVTGYTIQRNTCTDTGWVTIATVSGTTLAYTDNPGPGCYVYRVFATNAFGQTSGNSPNASISIGFVTTTKNINGFGCISGGTIQNIVGQSVIFTSTPAMALQITQASSQVALNKDPKLQITQASVQVSENRKNNLQITQAVLQVAMPYLGSYNHSFPGGTNNRGQG